VIFALPHPCPWPNFRAYPFLQTVWYFGGKKTAIKSIRLGKETLTSARVDYPRTQLRLYTFQGGLASTAFCACAHRVARVQGSATAKAFKYGTPIVCERGLAIRTGCQPVMRLQRSIEEAAYWPGGGSTLGPQSGLPHGHLQVSAKGDHVSFTTALYWAFRVLVTVLRLNHALILSSAKVQQCARVLTVGCTLSFYARTIPREMPARPTSMPASPWQERLARAVVLLPRRRE
jgi:hypothetical protein